MVSRAFSFTLRERSIGSIRHDAPTNQVGTIFKLSHMARSNVRTRDSSSSVLGKLSNLTQLRRLRKESFLQFPILAGSCVSDLHFMSDRSSNSVQFPILSGRASNAPHLDNDTSMRLVQLPMESGRDDKDLQARICRTVNFFNCPMESGNV